ncbi:MAG: hypothetical protein A2Z17_07215 [Gammaproteobacteria bacterium RBG_16_66_13]|nr:MAG: hypothetical protein A2Z17_07215 [Gammaproteobacteria bacterium RBG_16_66_13]
MRRNRFLDSSLRPVAFGILLAASASGGWRTPPGYPSLRPASQQAFLQQVNLPELWLSLEGCDPSPVAGACGRIPSLLVGADEPVDPSLTYAVFIRMDQREVECAGPPCVVTLEETGADGVEVEFWALSVADKRGRTFTARVRVLSTADPTEGGSVAWYVQVLSPQWRGDPVDACAVAWDTFPPPGPSPHWLATPDDDAELATHVVYHYLAARLITAGAVDVGECPDGGLLEGGVPSACGAEEAQAMVYEWQNQFDQAVGTSARRSTIPAWVIKGVIAEESQFWAATVVEPGEYGLGHLTEQGADNTLLWNKQFYDAFCPKVLGETYCGKGYAHQSDYRRALLRGSLIADVDADCPDCELGVDTARAEEGVSILSATLGAYCLQTGRMVSNVTREAPGRDSSYEDMWKLTLASYASGPGCVAEALKAAWRQTGAVNWVSVSGEFSEACAGARNYVDHVAR